MLSPQEIKNIFSQANAIITGDHFVYAEKADGWYHGSDYVNKDAIYPFVNRVSDLCKEIVRYFLDSGIDVVVGPTVGAVSLAQWTAHWFNYEFHGQVLAVCADEEDVLEERECPANIPEICPKEPPIILEFVTAGMVRVETSVYFGCLSINKVTYFEKVGTRRVIKRGYDKHVKGKRCLIVEDVINSGATVAKTRDAVLAAAGKVVGVGALCNRSGGKVTAQTLCVPELFSLLDLDMQMFPEADCPICKEKGPKSVRTDLGKGKDFLLRKGLSF